MDESSPDAEFAKEGIKRKVSVATGNSQHGVINDIASFAPETLKCHLCDYL
jgi:hypothetical protein